MVFQITPEMLLTQSSDRPGAASCSATWAHGACFRSLENIHQSVHCKGGNIDEEPHTLLSAKVVRGAGSGKLVMVLPLAQSRVLSWPNQSVAHPAAIVACKHGIHSTA